MKAICFVFLALFFVAACSGGSGRNLGGGGRYCPLTSLSDFGNLAAGSTELARYDLEKNVGTPEEVISAAHLPGGTYVLDSAEFLYVRKEDPTNARRWVTTQLREEIDAVAMQRQKRSTGDEGERIYKSSRYCVGGYGIDDPSYEAAMEGLTKLQVSAGNKIEFEVTSWGYYYDSSQKVIRPLYVETDASTGQEKGSWKRQVDQTKYSAPKDVFGDNMTALSLRRLAGAEQNKYQIFTKVDMGDSKTFYLLRVNLHFTPTNAP